MSEFYQHAATVFMGFFAIMNPVANTAVFVGLTSERSKAEQVRIAIKSLVVAFCIVAIFALLGKAIFNLFGITLPALRIAGGILVFMIGYHMLHGESSKMHKTKNDDGADEKDQTSGAADISVSPLAVPILAGPGTLATAMSFSADGGWEKISVTIAAFAILCLITCICFILGQRLVALVGESGVNIATRLMGLIMTVIGVQMVIAGITGAFPIPS